MRGDVEALQDQLLESVGEAIIASDLDGIVTYWNPAAEQMYGWTAGEAMGRSLREMLTAPEQVADADAIWDTLRSGLSWSGRFTVRRRDGSTFPAQVTDAPIMDSSGTLVGVIGISLDLSEREAISQRLHRLAAAVEAMRDGVVLVDVPQATVSYVNEAARRLLHGDAAAALGRPIEQVLPLAPEAVAAMRAHTLDGRVWRARVAAETPGQLSRHWDLTATAVHDECDRIAESTIAIRDVTAEVRAEDRLRASEARFRALVQRSADAALIADANGNLTYASPALRAVFGYEPWEVEGLSGFGFVHPDDLEKAGKLLSDVLEQPGSQPPVELRLRAADGRFIWTEETVSNQLHNPDVNGIVINLRDISGRKIAEEALAASERRYRAIVEAAEEGIWVLDEHDITTFANVRLERMLGLEPGAVVGRSPLEFVHPEDVDIVANSLAEQRSAEARSQRRTTLECRFVTTTGTSVQVLISTHAFFDDDGRYTGTQGMFTDVTELKLAQEHLQRLAVRDTLTGLANRTLLTEQLTTILDSQTRLPTLAAALCVDLDGDYRNVADAFGHEEGDRLLVEAGERLASAARPGDILGRSGAHEFVVLCADLDDLSEAHHIARRLHAAVAEPMEIGGRTTTVSAAVGIAHTPAGSAIELLRHAASAAHRAGRAARGGTAVFSKDLHDALRSELDLLEDLRLALTVSGQLVLEYQPVMALRGEQPVGVEALVRWRHPQRGLLAPDAFIPLAEDDGLIPSLDRWVLHEATTQLAAWREHGVVDADFRMAVNVSGSHYTDPGLVQDVRASLEATGIPAQNLVLEITETAVVTNIDEAMAVLRDLKTLGVGLSIDDFGTGYSSLAYLRRFPVDTLKIDRSFISGVADDSDDHAIVASTLSLARSVGMTCVAEGVETNEQLAALLELGCEQAQGYLWSLAVPAAELPAVLAFPYSSVGPRPRRASALVQPMTATHDGATQRQILELHHSGASLQTIAAALNRTGNRTDKGKRWHAATVARVVADVVASP